MGSKKRDWQGSELDAMCHDYAAEVKENREGIGLTRFEAG
jgi:hypothetical protein